MTAVAVGDTQIEVEGEGPPVVFVHGLGGTSNCFQPMLASFAGFRCIRLDLPGSGRSPRPYERLTIAHLAAAVIEVLRGVTGAPTHLVGHSLGTLVAQHVAVEAPDRVRSLSLFGPIMAPTDAARERLRERARAARRDMVAVADAIARSLSDPLAAAFLRESHMRQDREGFAQSCEALAEAEAADLRLIRCPALIATGDEDGVAPPSAAQALAEKLRGAKVKIFERCGHWTPLERPKECGKFATDFIRSVEA
jgi:pimeloyl-ACP methyl ester carboxylesterase